MEINTQKENEKIVLAVKGRLDTTTAPQLEAEINASLTDEKEMILDMAELEYVSSAGLRVILAAHKNMNKQGKMIVKNVNDTVMEVFNITGFATILNIE